MEVFSRCHNVCNEPPSCAKLQNITNMLYQCDLKENIDKLPEGVSLEIFLTTLYRRARTPSLPTEVEGEFHESDFKTDVNLLLDTLKSLIALSRTAVCKGVLSNKDVHWFTTVSVLLAYEHIGENYVWCCESAAVLCLELIEELKIFHKSESISRLLSFHSEEQRSILKEAVLLLHPNIAKNNWKQNPACMSVFVQLLTIAPSEVISESLAEVLPPVLLLLDDFETKHKIMGVKCAQCIIEGTTSSELRWHGRAELLYSAMKHLLYTKDAHLLEVLIPCILSLSKILDSGSKDSGYFTESKLDENFQIFLSNMDLEDNWRNRRIYASFLKHYTENLGICVVKYFARLFKIMFSYLEISDYPREETRLLILKALATLTRVAWVRVSKYTGVILQHLTKLIVDVTASDFTTTDNIRTDIITATNDVILMLAKANKSKTIEVVTALLHVPDLPVSCKNNFENVLLETDKLESILN